MFLFVWFLQAVVAVVPCLAFVAVAACQLVRRLRLVWL